MAKKSQIHDLTWAMGIVDFARYKDETRLPAHNKIVGFKIEPTRVVAVDGVRLAWQETSFPTAEAMCGRYDDKAVCIDHLGEFVDYQSLITQDEPIVKFALADEKDWLAALKRIARLHKEPYGTLESGNNEDVIVTLITRSPLIKAMLNIPCALRPPKSFEIGVNLMYLWEALDAAYRSDDRSYPKISIYSDKDPIKIETDSGFMCLTMPARVKA
jgi:hypothetical protein